MRLFQTGVLLIMLTGSLFISGCNTTKGIGQDIEAAGGAIEQEAKQSGAEGEDE